MKKLLTFLILLVQISLQGQDFNLEYSTQLGREFDYWQTHGIYTDLSNNFYITAFGTGTIDLDPSENEYNLIDSYYDPFIAKYSNNNELIWVINLKTSYRGEVYSIDFDENENVYITGRIEGTIDFDPSENVYELSSPNIGKIFVAKYNSDGEFIWVKQFGNKNNKCYSKQIKYVNDKIFILMKIYGEVDMDPAETTYIIDGGNNYSDAILELNSNGSFSNAQVFYDEIQVRKIEISENGICSYGSYKGTCNFDFKGEYLLKSKNDKYGFFPSYDAFIAEFDRNYNLKWAKSYGGIKNGDYISNAEHYEGDIRAFLHFQGRDTINEMKVDSGGYFSIVYSESGDILSFEKVLKEYNNFSAGFRYTNNNKLLISCYAKDTMKIDIWGTEYYLNPVPDFNNHFLIVFDENQKSILNASKIYCNSFSNYSLSLDTNDNIFVSFDFSSIGKLTFGSDSIINAIGYSDLLYQKINMCLPKETTISETACDSIRINNELFIETGTYTQTLINSAGCDSIINLNITINKQSEFLYQDTLCDSLIFNGISYDSSGIFTQILENTSGCDSIITIDIEIEKIDLNVYSIVDTLFAKEENAIEYSWINCKTGKEIINANQRIFIPTKSGEYAVRITKGDCTKLSKCITIVLTDISNISVENKIVVFPNPTSNYIIISGIESNHEYHVKIINLNGTVLQEIENTKEKEIIKIDLNHLSTGIYFVVIENELNTKLVKITKLNSE